MKQNPNQRSVIIHSSGRGVITKDELLLATKKLGNERNLTPFILFAHFVTNADGDSFDFSPKQFEAKTGISADRWRNAFSELIKKGYLVINESGENRFDFYT